MHCLHTRWVWHQQLWTWCNTEFAAIRWLTLGDFEVKTLRASNGLHLLAEIKARCWSSLQTRGTWTLIEIDILPTWAVSTTLRRQWQEEGIVVCDHWFAVAKQAVLQGGFVDRSDRIDQRATVAQTKLFYSSKQQLS